MGSLNINGGIDIHKGTLVSEVMQNKKSYMSCYCRKLIVILIIK